MHTVLLTGSASAVQSGSALPAIDVHDGDGMKVLGETYDSPADQSLVLIEEEHRDCMMN